MGASIKVDLGSTLPYVVDRVLEIFGKDASTRAWITRISEYIRISSLQAQSVQCLGMSQPISTEAIYLPLRIVPPGIQRETCVVEDLIMPHHTSKTTVERGIVIFGGPGRGKSMLLKHAYICALRDDKWLPLLFPLRSSMARGLLTELVDRLSSATAAILKWRRLLLLLDGYDEISRAEQFVVSEQLQKFQAAGAGRFLMTCRAFVNVYDVQADHCGILAFTEDDATRFIETFSTAYGRKINGAEVIRELKQRGFADFLASPLLLTFVCILRSGSSEEIPNNAIALLRRTLEVLTFRWDYERGIVRHPILEGQQCLRCLTRIAYEMRQLTFRQEAVEQIAQDYLRIAQRLDIGPLELLLDMARYYGVLVPAESGGWVFVHKSVHDYLAARYWVETGAFYPTKVVSWDTRAAYAACLTMDATQSMVWALRTAPDMAAFSECLYNKAEFEPDHVARAVIERFDHFNIAYVSRDVDFFRLCSNSFLRALVAVASRWTTMGADLVGANAVYELLNRGIKDGCEDMVTRLREKGWVGFVTSHPEVPAL